MINISLKQWKEGKIMCEIENTRDCRRYLECTESNFDTLEVKNYCELLNVASYVTQTKFVDVCGTQMLVVYYTVELCYRTNRGITRKAFASNTVSFLAETCVIDVSDLKVSVRSIASSEACGGEIKVKTTAYVYDLD